jgi:hypothetical protein
LKTTADCCDPCGIVRDVRHDLLERHSRNPELKMRPEALVAILGDHLDHWQRHHPPEEVPDVD